MNNTTCIIKTFERNDALSVLLKSIHRFYPGMRVVVVNDGRRPIRYSSAVVKCINTEFNIGLSAGRNRALEAVETDFFILLDDDFEFVSETRIENFHDVQLDTHADIVIGDVDNVVCGRFIFNKGTLEREPVPYNHVSGYIRVDCGPNFFLGKTDAVMRIKWDEKLKLVEHWDFFLRAKQAGLNVYYTQDVRIRHNKNKYGTKLFKKTKVQNKRECRTMAFEKHGLKENNFWRKHS